MTREQITHELRLWFNSINGITQFEHVADAILKLFEQKESKSAVEFLSKYKSYSYIVESNPLANICAMFKAFKKDFSKEDDMKNAPSLFDVVFGDDKSK